MSKSSMYQLLKSQVQRLGTKQLSENVEKNIVIACAEIGGDKKFELLEGVLNNPSKGISDNIRMAAAQELSKLDVARLAGSHWTMLGRLHREFGVKKTVEIPFKDRLKLEWKRYSSESKGRADVLLMNDIQQSFVSAIVGVVVTILLLLIYNKAVDIGLNKVNAADFIQYIAISGVIALLASIFARRLFYPINLCFDRIAALVIQLPLALLYGFFISIPLVLGIHVYAIDYSIEGAFGVGFVTSVVILTLAIAMGRTLAAVGYGLTSRDYRWLVQFPLSFLPGCTVLILNIAFAPISSFGQIEGLIALYGVSALIALGHSYVGIDTRHRDNNQRDNTKLRAALTGLASLLFIACIYPVAQSVAPRGMQAATDALKDFQAPEASNGTELHVVSLSGHIEKWGSPYAHELTIGLDAGDEPNLQPEGVAVEIQRESGEILTRVLVNNESGEVERAVRLGAGNYQICVYAGQERCTVNPTIPNISNAFSQRLRNGGITPNMENELRIQPPIDHGFLTLEWDVSGAVEAVEAYQSWRGSHAVEDAIPDDAFTAVTDSGVEIADDTGSIFTLEEGALLLMQGEYHEENVEEFTQDDIRQIHIISGLLAMPEIVESNRINDFHGSYTLAGFSENFQDFESLLIPVIATADGDTAETIEIFNRMRFDDSHHQFVENAALVELLKWPEDARQVVLDNLIFGADTAKQAAWYLDLQDPNIHGAGLYRVIEKNDGRESPSGSARAKESLPNGVKGDITELKKDSLENADAEGSQDGAIQAYLQYGWRQTLNREFCFQIDPVTALPMRNIDEESVAIIQKQITTLATEHQMTDSLIEPLISSNKYWENSRSLPCRGNAFQSRALTFGELVEIQKIGAEGLELVASSGDQDLVIQVYESGDKFEIDDDPEHGVETMPLKADTPHHVCVEGYGESKCPTSVSGSDKATPFMSLPIALDRTVNEEYRKRIVTFGQLVQLPPAEIEGREFVAMSDQDLVINQYEPLFDIIDNDDELDGSESFSLQAFIPYVVCVEVYNSNQCREQQLIDPSSDGVAVIDSLPVVAEDDMNINIPGDAAVVGIRRRSQNAEIFVRGLPEDESSVVSDFEQLVHRLENATDKASEDSSTGRSLWLAKNMVEVVLSENSSGVSLDRELTVGTRNFSLII